MHRQIDAVVKLAQCANDISVYNVSKTNEQKVDEHEKGVKKYNSLLQHFD